tara:strand:- start:24186 stop:27479 length:3294 start_codon:yes stop_codon:yes gene_type:complete
MSYKKGVARIIAILSVLIFLSWKSYAQSISAISNNDSLTTKVWTIEDGIPVNTVNYLTQDDEGYLWFTTYDGIVRFDGLEFKVYNHANTPVIPHNRATQIYKQDGVGIWISLEYGGVLLLTRNGFQHFGENEGFSKSDVTEVTEHSDGRIFFTTHEGLFVFENNRFKKFFDAENILQNRIRDVFEDVDASLWVATNNGVLHFKDGESKRYYISANEGENRFFSVYRAPNGDLLAGSTQGLYILKGDELVNTKKYSELKSTDVYKIFGNETITFFSTFQGLFTLENGIVNKIYDPNRKEREAYYVHLRDSKDRLWLVGERGTLSIYNDGKISSFNAVQGLGEEYYIGVFEDKENNIWISSSTRGLIQVKESIVTTISDKEGLSEDNILGLLEDSKGRYWVGTRGAGLNMIQNGKISYFKETRDIESSIVQTLAEDSLGNIWVGHYQKGINKISSRGKISHYSLGQKFDLNDVHSIYITKKGEKWVGTYAGLVLFDEYNSDHKIYTKEDGLAGSKIRYITEETDASLWIGTLDGGISHFKNNQFKNYSVENGLSSNNVRSIYIDEYDSEIIWVGTENNGLNRIKNGQITYINVNDGLPDYNIHWISHDNYGWLWMSTNKGVVKIDKEELNAYLDGQRESFRMQTFGRKDGMRNPEGNGSFQEAGIRTSEGTFWFATQDGVAIFKIKEKSSNIFSPKTVIKNVMARGESFSSDSIIFEPGINDFEINIHALTFINTSETRFRYRFYSSDDRNEEWIESGKERRIQFLDIFPGDYLFEAQATNTDGTWSPYTASIFIAVNPKYYQQGWFYILCVIGFILFLAGGWRLRYQKLVADQQKMEKIIEEQIQQIKTEKKAVELQKEIIEKQAKVLEQSNKTKDKFFSIIAHDLRNPFQAMLGYTEYLYDDIDNFDKDEVKEGIETIRESSKTLLNLTENLLTWANIQTGTVTPSPIEFAMNDLIDENEKLFTQSAKQKGIKLSSESDSNIHLYADQNMVNTVIRNLISNSIKFTKSGGSVLIKTECVNKKCRLTISDTGIGMNKDLLKGVMSLDSKSTREGTNNETGTGLGLVLCKEMVEMNNGTLNIESKEGIGTTFIVELPCK